MATRTLLRALAVGAVLSTTALTVPAANSAITNYDDCAGGKWCLYDGSDGTGAVYPNRSPHNNLHNSGWGDRARSFYNNTSNCIQVYEHTHLKGDHYTVWPGGRGNHTRSWGISSVRVVGCA